MTSLHASYNNIQQHTTVDFGLNFFCWEEDWRNWRTVIVKYRRITSSNRLKELTNWHRRISSNRKQLLGEHLTSIPDTDHAGWPHLPYRSSSPIWSSSVAIFIFHFSPHHSEGNTLRTLCWISEGICYTMLCIVCVLPPLVWRILLPAWFVLSLHYHSFIFDFLTLPSLDPS